MNILIACESSGRVREAFRARWHNAWSCDLEPSEIAGQHIRGDCLEYLEGIWEFDCGGYLPLTADPREHYCPGKHCFFRKIKWDMIGLHPPCEKISNVGNRWFKNNPQRWEERFMAIDFAMKCWNAPCEKIYLENPVGHMNREEFLGKPSQIIHPYYFGDPELKRTCLWLKGLPLLTHPDPKTLKKPEPKYQIGDSVGPLLPGMEHLRRKCQGKPIHFTESKSSSSIDRSRTFSAIARAMAEQWG